ncbi:MAG: hypothetical protein ACK4RS_04795, partial [Thiothrix sp.]
MYKESLAILAALSLSACAVPPGGYVFDPSPWLPQHNGVPPMTPQPVSFVDVYKYQGSRQCEGGGVSLADMQRQLQMAGVAVNRADCGMDGMMYPAFCGGADGRINIFSIDTRNTNAAFAQGFRPLSSLPNAQRVSCYANPPPSTNNTPPWTTGQGDVSTTYPYSGTAGDTSYYTYRLKPAN